MLNPSKIQKKLFFNFICDDMLIRVIFKRNWLKSQLIIKIDFKETYLQYMQDSLPKLKCVIQRIIKLLFINTNKWSLITNPFQKQPPDMFLNKRCSWKYRKIHRKIPVPECLFFNKVAGPMPATFFKKKLWHRCFPVNFAKFLRTPFLLNTSGGCFCQL